MLSSWITWVSRMEDKLASAVAGMSRKCARYPRVTILVYFALMVVFTTGLLQLNVVTDADRLWVDVESDTQKNRDVVIAEFPRDTRFNRVLVGLKRDGDGNIFDLDLLDTLFDIHERVENLVLSAKGDKGEFVGNFTLTDLCARRFDGECAYTGILKFWNYNRTFFDEFTTHAQVAELVGQPTYLTGEPVNDADFADFIVTRDDSGEPTAVSAKAGFLTWNLKPTVEVTGLKSTKSVQLQWEAAFSKLASSFADEYAGMELTHETRDSIDIELEAALSSDMILIVIRYV
jgi:hypothetical protein